VELFCSHVGGQTAEVLNCSIVMGWMDCRTVDLFCSNGGGRTV
jgi:hypothetical protein